MVRLGPRPTDDKQEESERESGRESKGNEGGEAYKGAVECKRILNKRERNVAMTRQQPWPTPTSRKRNGKRQNKRQNNFCQKAATVIKIHSQGERVQATAKERERECVYASVDDSVANSAPFRQIQEDIRKFILNSSFFFKF